MNENEVEVSRARRVVVGNAPQPMDATLLQMELGNYDIESELEGEFTLAIDPLLSNAIGGIRVLVAEADEARAKEVLREFYRKRREDESALERTCPKCGTTNAVPLKRPHLMGVVSVLTLGAFSLLFPWARFQCGECRHRWK